MKIPRTAIGLALAMAGGIVAEEEAQAILKESGVTGGLVVHVGCGDGKLTVALRANASLVVHRLDAEVSRTRETIRAAGLHGPVSAERWEGGALPYPDNLVRLVVVSAGHEARVSEKEMLRVLCPGGVAMAGGKKLVKPWPDGMDEWPQHYHGADNNAVARDILVGPPRHY
jgi:ubiquinone/menaquinone biosynthesis C-methylase UbiE